MDTRLLSLFSRTPMHVGAGSSVGVVDLPVIRERATGYPVVPGSSLKGVLADLWSEDWERVETKVKDERTGEEKIKVSIVRKKDSNLIRLFGSDDANAACAGALLVGESRILTFPVRSARGGFAWLTCPLVLNRLKRDFAPKMDLSAVELGTEEKCFAPETLVLDGAVILEEYAYGKKDDVPSSVLETLATVSADPLWLHELKEHLAVVPDDIFKYFVLNACEVAQHVKIDDETGVASDGALFVQENVPSEAMFTCLVRAVNRPKMEAAAALAALEKKLQDNGNLLQLGADATTGLGWCSASLVKVNG